MAFFVTFYSYKGGVGRSLALSNVAYSLASRGKKVVLVDMDLEAPGLDEVPELALRGAGSKKGFVEYADSYRRTGKCPGIKAYVHRCKESPGTGEIWLMPAGQLGPEYQHRLGLLTWTRLHPRRGTEPFIEGLKEGLRSLEPDYVLLDSRTGLADIAGLSTHRLADLIVLVFNLTRSCLEGSIQTYHSFTSEISQAKTVELVASPVPPAIPGSTSITEQRLQQAEQSMPLGVAYGRRINQIVYDPAMVLTEELPVRHPDRFPAAERYETLRESIQRANPEEVFPVVEQAQLLWGQGQLEEGLRLLRDFTERYPQQVEGFLALGDMLLKTNQEREAVAAFRSACGIAPKLALTHRRLGEALVLQEDGAAAVETLKRAEALGDASTELYRALTRAYGQLNEPGKELEARRKSITTLLGNPGHLKASPTDARELRREFTQVLSRRPPYPGFEADAFWDEVMGSLSLDLRAKTLLLRVILEGSPEVKSLRTLLQGLQEEKQRWLHVLGPNAPALQKRVAANFLDLGQESAVDQLRRGDPVDAALLGFIATQTEAPTRRKELLEQALEIDAQNPALLFGLGAVLSAEMAPLASDAERLNLLQQAADRYKLALGIKPDQHEAFLNWGSTLVDLAHATDGDGQIDLLRQAIDKFKLAIDIKPDKHDAFYNWGIALGALAEKVDGEAQRDLLSQAIDKFKLALDIKPDKHEALNNWAAILLKLQLLEGDETAARALVMEAVNKSHRASEIKPGAGDYNLACALSRLGEFHNAAALIRADLQRSPHMRSDALKDPDLQPLWTARPDLKEAIEREAAEVNSR
jgi:tetratricopeptide (TPR) repeat protein